jgi:hypothetical protein
MTFVELSALVSRPTLRVGVGDRVAGMSPPCWPRPRSALGGPPACRISANDTGSGSRRPHALRDAIEWLLAREVIENVTSKDSKGKHDGRYHLHLKQPATMEED